LDSAGQGLYSGKRFTKINKDSLWMYKKIEKHAYLGSQSKFGKTKQNLNSKIPEPKFLRSCEQNILKKVAMEINGLRYKRYKKEFIFCALKVWSAK
jgi:hypothetical protein